MKKLFLILSIAVGLFTCIGPEARAADIEAMLEDAAGASGFNIQDSAGASKVYAKSDGKVGIGTIAPSGLLSVTPAQYSTGTASQSGTTVTGAGTTFTSAMVGSQLVYANGVSAGTITAYTSATALTVSTSQTVAEQAYTIAYTGLQVAATGYVGIGTTDPQATLDVGGTGIRLGGVTRTSWNEGTVTSVTGTAPVVSSGGNTPAISMAAATASVDGYMTSTYATKLDGIATGAADTTNDSWSGTGDVTMTSGNVGIGTTEPSEKIDIIGNFEITPTGGTSSYKITGRADTLGFQNIISGRNSNVEFYSNDGDGTDNVGFNIWGVGTPSDVTTNGEYLEIAYHNTNEFIVGSQELGTGTIRPIRMFTGTNTNQLVLATDGKVGIGTTGPGAKLHVYDPTQSMSVIFQADQTYADSVTVRLKARSNANSQLDFADENDDDIGRIVYGHATDSLGLFTNNTEQVRITSDGNVGIGTTAPLGTLHVQSATNKDITWASGTDTSGGEVTIGDGGTGSTSSLWVNTPGVNANHHSGLGIRGSIYGNISTININAYGTNSATGYGSNLAFSTTNDTTLTEWMRIDKTGNVGIGTTAPGEKLDVSGGSIRLVDGNQNLVFLNPSYVDYHMKANSDGHFALYRYDSGSTDYMLKLVNWGGGTGKLGLYVQGNVGIGTTSPSARLHTLATTEQLRLGYDASNYWSGTVGATGGLTLAGTGAGGALTLTPTAGQNLNVSLSTTGDFAVNTSQLYVDTSAGNVGIGTTAPGSALDVKGTLRLSGSTSGYVGFAPAAVAGSTSYTLPSADGTAGQVLSTNGAQVLSWATAAGGGSSISAGDSNVVVTDAGDGYITFTEDNSEKMRITGGNVGIGTANPTGRLHVKVASTFSATGGTITYSGGYTIHTFTSSGAFIPNSVGEVEYLVVGGGGAGAADGPYNIGCGGGGGGGFATGTGHAVSAQSYTVTVGAGGVGGYSVHQVSGSNSVFSTITAIGGGGGGSSTSGSGANGGSGGGGGAPAGVGGAETSGQGFAGGVGATGQGGGGGGAGEIGNTDGAGEGGDGLASSISGSSVYYAGGGGGSGTSGAKAGGNGGGGASGTVGVSGTANTGGGGGAQINDGATSGSGGSGIVIVRYLTDTPTEIDSLVVNSTTGNVGIGTTDPGAYKLHVEGGMIAQAYTTGDIMFRVTDDGPDVWRMFEDTHSLYTQSLVTGQTVLTIKDNGNVGIGTTNPTHLITLNGGAYCDGTGAWVAGSDRAYKKEIDYNFKYGLKEIELLKPVYYVHKQDETGKKQIGFIAQDMLGVIPEVVSGSEGALGLSYGQLTAVLVKAVQEQQKEIEELKARVSELERKK